MNINEYHHVLMYRNRPLVCTNRPRVYIFLKCMLCTYDTIITVYFCLCTDNTVSLDNVIIFQRSLACLLPMVFYRQLTLLHHLVILLILLTCKGVYENIYLPKGYFIKIYLTEKDRLQRAP